MASNDIDIANSGENLWIFQYRYMIQSLVATLHILRQSLTNLSLNYSQSFIYPHILRKTNEMCREYVHNVRMDIRDLEIEQQK